MAPHPNGRNCGPVDSTCSQLWLGAPFPAEMPHHANNLPPILLISRSENVNMLKLWVCGAGRLETTNWRPADKANTRSSPYLRAPTL